MADAAAPAVEPAPAVTEPEPAVAEPEIAHQASLAELTRAQSRCRRAGAALRTAAVEHSRGDHPRLRPKRTTVRFGASEFYSSGFLTENQHLPWAKVIGPVTPSQIGSSVVNDAMPYSTIAIEAPRGATYQIGDTLLLAQPRRGTGSPMAR